MTVFHGQFGLCKLSLHRIAVATDLETPIAARWTHGDESCKSLCLHYSQTPSSIAAMRQHRYRGCSFAQLQVKSVEVAKTILTYRQQSDVHIIEKRSGSCSSATKSIQPSVLCQDGKSPWRQRSRLGSSGFGLITLSAGGLSHAPSSCSACWCICSSSPLARLSLLPMNQPEHSLLLHSRGPGGPVKKWKKFSQSNHDSSQTKTNHLLLYQDAKMFRMIMLRPVTRPNLRGLSQNSLPQDKSRRFRAGLKRKKALSL